MVAPDSAWNAILVGGLQENGQDCLLVIVVAGSEAKDEAGLAVNETVLHDFVLD